MIKILTTVLIVVASVASVYNAYVWIRKPESGLLYRKANFSLWGIQLLSLLLGIGGCLLLFPRTFVIGATLLLIHSFTTLVCYGITRDVKGGLREFILFQIPVFLLWAGYPLVIFDKLGNLLASIRLT